MNKRNSRLHQFCACAGYSAKLFRLMKRLFKIVNCVLKRTVIEVLLCRDLVNRYILGRVLHKDQRTLKDCIRLFNSVFKIFSVYTDILLSKYV